MFVLPNAREQLKVRRPAWITYALILINIVAFVITFFSGSGAKELAQLYGNSPIDPRWWTFFSSMFLHVGTFHLFGNMLFLYLTGAVLEDLWGRPLFLSFYIATGILATRAFDVRYPESDIPFVGASGAVSGLIGAFLVRLFKTRISFFYFPRFSISKMFQAPAWVVPALWIVLQIILFAVLNKDSGVTFTAHIAGFLFGALFGIIMVLTRFEQKFINSNIESQASDRHKQQFLDALRLSKEHDFVQAMDLLKQVISGEPDHLEAFMEMRRIAELTENQEANSEYTGAFLEVLVRKNEKDLVHRIYTDYMRIPRSERKPLPIKALFSVCSFMEMVPDYRSAAVEVYNQLIEWYPEDLLSLKAVTTIVHLYIEKFDNRKKGVEILTKAYHDNKNPEWRKILEAEFKRYRISSPVEVASPDSPHPQTLSRSDSSVLEPNLLEGEPAGELFLPDEIFDGKRAEWNQVPCWIERIEAAGVMLRNDHHLMGLLRWDKVKFVSVGRVRIIPPGSTKPEKEYLIVDLVSQPQSNCVILYRTSSQRFYFKKIFPGLEINPSDGYHKMMTSILNSSNPLCIPDREKCLGPAFAVFSSVNHYETQLKAMIISQGINP